MFEWIWLPFEVTCVGFTSDLARNACQTTEYYAGMIEHVSPDPNPGCEHLFLYKGVRVSQSRHVFGALDTLAAAVSPARVVETGTLYGGFTRILREHAISREAQVVSFDIVDTLVGEVPDVRFEHVDVFSPAGLERVASEISSPGRTVLFCDGGDKVREVRAFARYLKPGDVILCHDYMHFSAMMGSEEVGNWPGCEVVWSDISAALEEANCEPFLEAEMQRAVWGCFIKR